MRESKVQACTNTDTHHCLSRYARYSRVIKVVPSLLHVTYEGCVLIFLHLRLLALACTSLLH